MKNAARLSGIFLANSGFHSVAATGGDPLILIHA
jgi:hypothetical protein